MFNFLRNPKDKQSVKVYPNFNNCQFVIQEDVTRTIDYYKKINWSVSGDHILVTLLNSIHSEAVSHFDIYGSIMSMVPMVTAAKGIASNVAYGKVQHKSYFYGKDSQEILIDQRFDDAYDQMLYKPYHEWETVRIVRHPFSSLDFQLPNGKLRKSDERGLVIIKMDLALLYTQYKLWLRDYDASHYFDGTNKAITNFVHSYPIPYMLKSHVDMVWFNRLFFRMMGKNVSSERPDNRLALPNPYIGLDMIEKRIHEDVLRNRWDFYEISSIMPCFFNKNLLSFFRQDAVLETQQIRLPWVLGYLPLIQWLLMIQQNNPTGANEQYLTQFERHLKEYQSSNLFRTVRFLPEIYWKELVDLGQAEMFNK